MSEAKVFRGGVAAVPRCKSPAISFDEKQSPRPKRPTYVCICRQAANGPFAPPSRGGWEEVLDFSLPEHRLAAPHFLRKPQNQVLYVT